MEPIYYNSCCPEPADDFVAIDVEWADYDQSICQFGLTEVRGGVVQPTRTWMIRPIDNRYGAIQIAIHGITPADTENMRSLPEVWPEIEPLLRGKQLWAHNALRAEQPVIEKNLSEHYQIPHTPYIIHDSLDLYQRDEGERKLPLCCMAIGVRPDGHHQADRDSEMCAELVLAYARGIRPDWTNVPKTYEDLRKHLQEKVYLSMGQFQDYAERLETVKKKLKSRPETPKDDGQTSMFDTELEESPLTADDEHLLYHTDVHAFISSTRDCAPLQRVDVWDKGDAKPAEGKGRVDFSRLRYENHPLNGKKVAITGVFNIGRKEIQRALEAMGAEMTSGVAKTTGALLIGESGVGFPKLAAMEKLVKNGYVVPRIVGDKDLDEFLYGDVRLFHIGESAEPRKQLDLTYAHFEENRWQLSFPLSSIANKELYVPMDIAGDRCYFVQMCGNIGAFANEEMDEITQIIVLPDDTLERLRRGEKDDRIRSIEKFYNSLRAVTFELQFLPLSDILLFLRQRIVRCSDEVTERLYVPYLRSAGIDPETDERFGLATAREQFEEERLDQS